MVGRFEFSAHHGFKKSGRHSSVFSLSNPILAHACKAGGVPWEANRKEVSLATGCSSDMQGHWMVKAYKHRLFDLRLN